MKQQQLLLLIAAGFVLASRFLRQNKDRAQREEATPLLTTEGWIVVDQPAEVRGLPFPDFAAPRRGCTIEYQILRVGSPDTAFQYRYSVGLGSGRSNQRSSCALLTVPFDVPLISVKRGGPSALDRWFGGRVRTGDETFDRVFYVTSSDERCARDLLTHDVREWFYDVPRSAAQTIFRFSGTQMLAIGPRMSAASLPALFNLADSLRDVLPDDLAQLYPIRSR